MSNRKKTEAFIIRIYDILDKTGTNSEFYKKKFAAMNDKEFLKFLSLGLPLKFHWSAFTVEPSMNDIFDSAKALKVKLIKKIKMAYLYTDKKGNAVITKPCLVGPIHIKKLKQFVTKKNSMTTSISEKDMRTGLLINDDKNGITSDREFEALLVMGCEHSTRELSRLRADSMKAQSLMHSHINNDGMVYLKDIPIEADETLSKNMLDVYMIGAGFKSNIVTDDYYLPKTMNDRKQKLEREI